MIIIPCKMSCVVGVSLFVLLSFSFGFVSMGKFFRGMIVDAVPGPSSGLFAYLTRIMAFSSLAEKEMFQVLLILTAQNNDYVSLRKHFVSLIFLEFVLFWNRSTQ